MRFHMNFSVKPTTLGRPAPCNVATAVRTDIYCMEDPLVSALGTSQTGRKTRAKQQLKDVQCRGTFNFKMRNEVL